MIDGKEGASGSSWKGPPVLPVRDDSMEQVTWEQCVLKDDKNLPDSKWGQWMGKAFREQLGQSCGGIETPLLLSFILPQQVWCPIGVSPCVAEGGDLPGSHAPVPALLPSTPQEGLQANSLLTPPSPAEPPHSLGRDHAASLPWAQGAETSHRLQDFGGTCLEGTPTSYWVFELTSCSSHTPGRLGSLAPRGQLTCRPRDPGPTCPSPGSL